MIPYKHAWYKSPIDLPERTIGKFSIKHRVVTGKTPVVGARQAYTRGLRPLNAKLSEPLLVHELHEGGHGLWMTDLPEELNQIEEMLHTVKPQGRVLVGGLGLGIVAERLAILGCDVTVVERSRAIIKLCATSPGYTTVCDYIEAFLKGNHPRHQTPYDFYLLDTWCGTSEATWWGNVMPLRRAIRNRWGSKPIIHCWAEDIMLGQVQQSLVIDEMKKEMLRLHNADTNNKKKFTLQDCRRWYYKYFPVDMTPAQANWFLENVGTKAWEHKYGKMIDKVTTKEGRK